MHLNVHVSEVTESKIVIYAGKSVFFSTFPIISLWKLSYHSNQSSYPTNKKQKLCRCYCQEHVYKVQEFLRRMFSKFCPVWGPNNQSK